MTRGLATHLLSKQSSWLPEGSERRSLTEDRRLARVIAYMSVYLVQLRLGA